MPMPIVGWCRERLELRPLRRPRRSVHVLGALSQGQDMFSPHVSAAALGEGAGGHFGRFPATAGTLSRHPSRALFARHVRVGRRASQLLARCAGEHTGLPGAGDHRPEPGDAAVPGVHSRIPRRARFLHLPVRVGGAQPRRPAQGAQWMVMHPLTPRVPLRSERLLQQWQTGGPIALEVDLAHLGGFNEQLLDILQRHPADNLPLVRAGGRFRRWVSRTGCARAPGGLSPPRSAGPALTAGSFARTVRAGREGLAGAAAGGRGRGAGLPDLAPLGPAQHAHPRRQCGSSTRPADPRDQPRSQWRRAARQAADVNRLLRVPGIVISASRARPKATSLALRCTSCQAPTTIPIHGAFGVAQLPRQCTACVAITLWPFPGRSAPLTPPNSHCLSIQERCGWGPARVGAVPAGPVRDRAGPVPLRGPTDAEAARGARGGAHG